MFASEFFGSHKRNPLTAFIRVLGTFLFCSLVFNVFVAAFAKQGLLGLVTGLFGAITMGLATLALFSVPIAKAADTSPRHKKRIVLAAGATALLLYVAALRYEAHWITNWMFPHWPGVDPEYSSNWIQFAAAFAAIIFGAGCLGTGETASDAIALPQEHEVWAPSMVRDGLEGVGGYAETQDAAAADLEVDFG